MLKLPVWVWNWQHQSNNISYEYLVLSLYVSLFAFPLGLSLLSFYPPPVLFFPCWTDRDNRPILFIQRVSFLFFIWDTVYFPMTATKWNFCLLNYWILWQTRRTFTFTFQGPFKHCAALASLHFDCLLGCFCQISERFSPLFFHLSVFEHEPTGLHGRNAQSVPRTSRITLERRLNATQLLSADRRGDQCSCLGTLETLDLIKWLMTHTLLYYE